MWREGRRWAAGQPIVFFRSFVLSRMQPVAVAGRSGVRGKWCSWVQWVRARWQPLGCYCLCPWMLEALERYGLCFWVLQVMVWVCSGVVFSIGAGRGAGLLVAVAGPLPRSMRSGSNVSFSVGAGRGAGLLVAVAGPLTRPTHSSSRELHQASGAPVMGCQRRILLCEFAAA